MYFRRVHRSNCSIRRASAESRGLIIDIRGERPRGALSMHADEFIINESRWKIDKTPTPIRERRQIGKRNANEGDLEEYRFITSNAHSKFTSLTKPSKIDKTPDSREFPRTIVKMTTNSDNIDPKLTVVRCRERWEKKLCAAHHSVRRERRAWISATGYQNHPTTTS